MNVPFYLIGGLTPRQFEKLQNHINLCTDAERIGILYNHLCCLRNQIPPLPPSKTRIKKAAITLEITQAIVKSYSDNPTIENLKQLRQKYQVSPSFSNRITKHIRDRLKQAGTYTKRNTKDTNEQRTPRNEVFPSKDKT